MHECNSPRPTHDEIATLTGLLKHLPEDKRNDLLEYGNKMLDLHTTHARIVAAIGSNLAPDKTLSS